jgi:putative transposase
VLFEGLETHERISKILADQGYEGHLEEDIEAVYEVVFEVVTHEGKGFSVQAKRWIAERTWAWLENSRGLTRDYERLAENHEGMVYAAMIRLMLRRLENNRKRWQQEDA